jgi:hypothetical protein
VATGIMATTAKCLVESDLLESKQKCIITASTLEEFTEALLSSLNMSIPTEQLMCLIYDTDFEDFVGECSLVAVLLRLIGLSSQL